MRNFILLFVVILATFLAWILYLKLSDCREQLKQMQEINNTKALDVSQAQKDLTDFANKQRAKFKPR